MRRANRNGLAEACEPGARRNHDRPSRSKHQSGHASSDGCLSPPVPYISAAVRSPSRTPTGLQHGSIAGGLDGDAIRLHGRHIQCFELRVSLVIAQARTWASARPDCTARSSPSTICDMNPAATGRGHVPRGRFTLADKAFAEGHTTGRPADPEMAWAWDTTVASGGGFRVEESVTGDRQGSEPRVPWPTLNTTGIRTYKIVNVADDSALFDIETGPPHPAEAGVREDAGLTEVSDWFRKQKNMEERFGSALRQSIDEVLDGQRTGRFDVDSLEKTEKTYLGTKVEIVIRSEFALEKGGTKEMDYRIAGHPVDCKFSLTGNWYIPSEAIGHIALLVSANDHMGTFCIGLARISEDILNKGNNKDGKKTISKDGKNRILWICRDAALPQNLLLQLSLEDREKVDAIMSRPSGQQRINELLMRVQGTVIDRNTAITVAQQLDGMKRCRDARHQVRKSGTVLLGHQKDGPIVAKALGLPEIQKGTYIAVRLIEVPEEFGDRPTALIDDRHYAIANDDEPSVDAPIIDL